MQSKIVIFMYVLFSFTTCMSMNVKDREEEARPFIAESNKDQSEADASVSTSQSEMKAAVTKDVAFVSQSSSGNYKIGGIEIPGGVAGGVVTLIGGSALLGGAVVGLSRVAQKGVRKVADWYSEKREVNQLKEAICADTSENGPDPQWCKDLANLVAQIVEEFPDELDRLKGKGAEIKADPFFLVRHSDCIESLDKEQGTKFYYTLSAYAEYDFQEQLNRIVNKESQKDLLELAKRQPRLFDKVFYSDQLDEEQRLAIDTLYQKDEDRVKTLKGIGDIFKCIEPVYEWNTEETNALLESEDTATKPLLHSEEVNASETVEGSSSASTTAVLFGKASDEDE